MSDTERRGATSASNALADSLCLGRHQAQSGIPDTEGQYAAHGRIIHEALADSGVTANLVAMDFSQRETFDACRELEKRLVGEFFGKDYFDQRKPETGMRVFREERYWVKVPFTAGKLTQLFEHSGKPDVVFKSGVRALVLEYKTLPGDVPGSPRNLQLRDQAVLVSGNLRPITEVGVAVIQPMVTRSPEICLYGAEDLKRAEAEMFARVIASNDPKSPRIAGEAQCGYCRAKRQCLEYQKWASQMTPPAMLQVMEVPIALWSPEQRQIAANALSPAKKFLKDLEDFFKEGLKADPSFLPGWELKPGNMVETITDPQQAFERFTGIGGTTEQFMQAVSLGKMKLKEAVSAVTGARGRALDDAMKGLTAGISETSQNAPSLKKSGGDK